MGEYVVKLPDVGEGVAEAEIVAWHVEVGQTIDEDAVFVEVMTDKATVELPTPTAGRVTRLAGEVGDLVAVGAGLLWLDVDEAARTEPVAGEPVPADPVPAESAPDERDVAGRDVVGRDVVGRDLAGRDEVGSATVAVDKVVAAPAVRQRARALSIDLTRIAGTGSAGQITHADLDSYLLDHLPNHQPNHLPNHQVASQAAGHQQDATIEDTIEDVRIVGLRRNIARRMQEAYRRIPHFTYVDEIDVGELERLRSQLNSDGADRPRLTILPFLARAVVLSVRDFPQMNSRFDDEAGVLRRHTAVHLGVATQTPKGLMVPVVHDASGRDLWSMAIEVARLAAAARDSTIALAELTGSTITITSLGALGGIVSTPIINAPEVAIIGVNKIAIRPVHQGGQWVPRSLMNLSSSFDHRVIDGADAAEFIQRIKLLLETPALLFVGG